MRLLLTVVVGGAAHDLAVDAEDDATHADLAASLAARLTGSRGSSEGSAPPLFLGRSPLDPGGSLTSSPVRHGSVVGLGQPVAPALQEPEGLVEVRLTGGPGSGQVVRLTTGDHTVGAAAGAAVPLPQIGLPGQVLDLQVRPDRQVVLHPRAELSQLQQEPVLRRRPLPGPIVLAADAEIRKREAGESTYQELPPGTRVLDPEAPMPLVHLDREPVQPGQTWQPGQALVIGPCLLELVVPHRPDASLSLSPQGATLDFNRPPRMLPPPRATEFQLPSEPRRAEKQMFPWPIVMMPLLIGPVMLLVTKNLYSLLIIVMMPLMALGNTVGGRRQEKKRYENDYREYVVRMRRIQEQALVALREERAARGRDFADPSEVLMTAVGPRARLWERRRTDPDWLVARFGTADQVSSVSVKSPAREQHEGALVWTAPDVPVTVPLADAGVTGVCGGARVPVVRGVLAQLATLHSPVDLRMVLLSSPEAERDWRWARWLPHLRSDDGDPEIAQVGVDEETTTARIGELLGLLEARVAAHKERSVNSDPGAQDPVLVVLDGSRRLRLVPGMIPLLQVGPRYGITFLCLDDDERLLPEECTAVVHADEPLGSVRVSGQGTIEGVRPDVVSSAWAERVARGLAAIRDVSGEDAAAAIPGSSRLLDVIRLDPPTAEAVAQRWAQVGRTTTAVLGEGADGRFVVDMVRDGPHGLIAGTTGSGKSELLQTLIASLAVDNRPDEMTFVLVDYKGGAAFKDCNNLPHTVGMVTDLDGHLTSRALESLGAELRRREHQLAGADAKDIEDYLATKAPGDEPMPRLLIVIDEFAALVAELPDFVTGLVDIARRGRSLGVHLLLATQRPAGVVSAEIKSNTNLRIALRVTDRGDSTDVIESPDAAEISKGTPGRAYARLGHSSLIPFQSSRVGGRPRGVGQLADVRLREVTFATLGVAPALTAEVEEDATTPTDLATLVQAARDASAATGIGAPPSPWLPALPDDITVESVLTDFSAAIPTADRLVLPFGMIDLPSQQRRDVATYDLSKGHLGVAGAPRSGRSTLLRALAGVVGRYLSPADVHIYGVDCGNNALLPLVSLPHVGAVVTRDQTDRMDRLVTRLRGLISARQQGLAEQGYADVAEQRANVASEQRMAYVLVLFDRWEGFFQAYDGIDGGRLVAAWQQILQEGAAVGIRVVMTGDRSLTLGRMATLLDDKIILKMTDPSDFTAIGMPLRSVPSQMTEGRGFRAEGLRETQVGLLADDPAGTAQVAALQTIGRESTQRWAAVPASARPFHVDVLPMRVTMADALELARREREQGGGEPVPSTSLPVAVGGDTLSVRYLDALQHGPAVLVTGARRSGRSTVLRTMAVSALEAGWNVLVVTPRISPLRDLAGQDGVFGPFDLTSPEKEVEALMGTLRDDAKPLLAVVDDIEILGADSWLAEQTQGLIEKLRDTESMVVGAGSPAEMQGMYRGPAMSLKRSGSGIMLAPQTSSDPDLFGARVNRSIIGAAMPPGGGYFVAAGQIQRVQVIWPG